MNQKTYCDPNPYEYNEDGLKLRDSLYKTFEKVYREQRELGYSPAEVKCLIIDTLVSSVYLVDALMACEDVNKK